MIHSLRNIWHKAWTSVFVEMNDQETRWLLFRHEHIALLEKRRTTLIVSRVRLVAALFALLTPLWILVDIAAFSREVWLPLVVARIAATLAFALITLLTIRMRNMADAYHILAMLFLVPMAFFLYSYQHMAQFELNGVQQAFSTGYAFLPFVMLAGLSVFPLTLAENMAFVVPLLLLQVVAGAMRMPVLDWSTLAVSFWLTLLIAGVSVLAGLSQLAFIIVLVRETIRDNMTGCFSRQSGEELLDLQFVISRRSDCSLTAAFIDIDHFKNVNDNFGHEAGDLLLIGVVKAIQDHLRMGDMLIRWGGEEFVLILPNTTPAMACVALQRLRRKGLGTRPDGAPITASIGIAERIHDEVTDWRQLIEKSDARMYEAKQSGRDRVVGCCCDQGAHG
ncbi:MAG: GGDEF domain-containing protein [Betaproteobacteria bacterium]|nr:GGDEF domain-containing protein [Betaproteobacteria bacterium]